MRRRVFAAADAALVPGGRRAETVELPRRHGELEARLVPVEANAGLGGASLVSGPNRGPQKTEDTGHDGERATAHHRPRTRTTVSARSAASAARRRSSPARRRYSARTPSRIVAKSRCPPARRSTTRRRTYPAPERMTSLVAPAASSRATRAAVGPIDSVNVRRDTRASGRGTWGASPSARSASHGSPAASRAAAARAFCSAPRGSHAGGDGEEELLDLHDRLHRKTRGVLSQEATELVVGRLTLLGLVHELGHHRRDDLPAQARIPSRQIEGETALEEQLLVHQTIEDRLPLRVVELASAAIGAHRVQRPPVLGLRDGRAADDRHGIVREGRALADDLRRGEGRTRCRADGEEHRRPVSRATDRAASASSARRAVAHGLTGATGASCFPAPSKRT